MAQHWTIGVWTLAAATAAAVGLNPQPAESADRDCSDFPNQAAAQRFYVDQGGPDRDPHRLDADRDGVACESLPCPCSTSTRRGGERPKKRKRRRARSEVISGRIRSVVDGDTVKVRATRPRRRNYTVRLIGVDTPETKRPGTPVECGGPEATDSMRAMALHRGRGRRVRLRTDPSQGRTDRFGRLLAYVETTTGRQLNVSQVSKGWSRAYVFRKRFRQYGRFRRAERRARRARRGVWELCDGDFHRPAE